MKNIRNIGGIIVILSWLAIVCLFAYGWVNNLMTLLHMDFGGTITLGVILRIIGIFVAPVGAILGFM